MTVLWFAPGCSSSKTVVAPERDTEKARWNNDHAVVLLRHERYEEAERMLRKAIEADVMYAPARNNLGLLYYHRGKLYEAAWEFQNAIRLMPHVPEPRNNLGLVFERAGKFTDAVESYEQARRIAPDNPEFLGNLARARIQRGDRDAGLQQLLEEVVMKDSRPVWRDWAKMQLLKLTTRAPATEPAAR